MAAVEADSRHWIVIRVRSPSEESAAWLAEGLIEWGATAVQEEDGGKVLRVERPNGVTSALWEALVSPLQLAGQQSALDGLFAGGTPRARGARNGLLP